MRSQRLSDPEREDPWDRLGFMIIWAIFLLALAGHLINGLYQAMMIVWMTFS